ncbi:YIP1 family protein [Halodesulfovibrio sp.]|jgi:DNA-directed RNA polymerase subunit RPC12/RpoP|uniref:YIP1 family protein n=1 Tax=Halodesulfovibrio sp. TaxID=1912772 RepID=UPI0025E27F22|nr:YIP1 family protein [Halodesulfovibrio sp.]MCT4626283.1 zinc-ribbon domain-containing protein [Halodesulfovibrio sp.]
MEIRCPECGYTRKINPDSVSPELTVATCPKCSSKFRFRPSEDSISSQEPESEQLEIANSDMAQEQNSVEKTDEQSRPVRPEDLYPPSVHAENGSTSEQRDFSSKKLDDFEDEQREEFTDDPLRMVYSDGKPLDGMPSDVPWAEVKELGFFPAIAATIKGVFFKPTLFFEIMNKSGKFSIPFSYFILISLTAVLVETVWQGIFGNPLLPAEGQAMGIEELFSVMFISPLILVVYLYTTALVLHVALKLTGAAKKPIGVTLRVLCYASTADLCSIVPVVGPLIGGIMKLVIIVKGLKTAHNTTYSRVIPPVGILVLVILSVVVHTLQSLGTFAF